jgi:ribonucleoside-diphosphate reductase alpha chain
VEVSNARPKLQFKGDNRGTAGAAWSSRPSRILNERGQVLHSFPSIEAPTTWSDQAVNIVARQYLRQRLPGGGSEISIRQLIERVSSSIREFGETKLQLFSTEKDAAIFQYQLEDLVLQQQASFNSPVWFNCGLWPYYGVVGSDGNWAIDSQSKTAVKLENSYERPQVSACFIQSIEDDLNSIFELVKSEARLFKFGSGTGSNFSNLRSRHELLSGGGTSSGLMSFLEVFDRAAGATKSGGTTRRAAKMVCLDLDHPEIFEFVRWKAKEESKAQALVAAGFSSGMDGEAYHTVSGQNSNNSVRVTDEFMKAVEDDTDWSTAERTTGKIVETFKARKLMRAIAESAWLCADPGLQFESAIQAWHTCKNTDRIRASNPCSEFMFLDDTACNLASLNLIKFLDDKGAFQVSEFQQAVRALIVAQDILVDLASYPSKRIAERSYQFRPLGLGYANLGATLMSLGLPYDSEEARCFAAAVTSLMTGEAYSTSAELAKINGAFQELSANRLPMLEVLEKHLKADQLRTKLPSYAEIDRAAREAWAASVKLGSVSGIRNSQVTVLAPTGTIAFMMDCDTTGIEPEFALVKRKTLAGGGALTIENQSMTRALIALKYSTDEAKNIVAHLRAEPHRQGETGFLESIGIRNEHVSIFHCAAELSPEAHLKMMASVQPFLSGAISKTVNLSKRATVEEVEEVFKTAWRLGLKAVAVYRDGSKGAQPLTISTMKNAENTGRAGLSRGDSLCPVCQYPAVLSGTCWVCPNCGHSISCS